MGDNAVHARMVARAQIQVRAAWEAKRILLDFTPESVATLDRLIASDIAKKPRDAETLCEVIGAYLGEVIVRRLGATWQGTEDEPELCLGEQRLLPVEQVRLRLQSRRRGSLERYYSEIAKKAGVPVTNKGSAPSLLRRLQRKQP